MRSTRFKTRGGGAAPSDADIIWPDALHLTDKIAPKPIFPDVLRLTDLLAITHPRVDALHLLDTKVATVTADKLPTADALKLGEGLVLSSFDQEPHGDAYTIEGSGNPGAGTTTLLVTLDTAITTGNDAYMKFNLRNDVGGPLEGLTARATPNNALTVAVTVSHNVAVVAQTMDVAALIQDADPWGEGTITFANAPAHGVAQGSIAVAAGAAQRLTLTITSVMGAVLGNWLSLRFRAAALQTATFTIASRENATSANRPRLAYQLERLTP